MLKTQRALHPRVLVSSGLLMLLMSGCSGPELLGESRIQDSPAKVTSLLIEVDTIEAVNGVTTDFVREFGDGIGQALRENAGNIPVALVHRDPVQIRNETARAIIEQKPSQLIRAHPVTITSNAYGPISAVWEIEVLNLNVRPSDDVAGQRHLTTITRKLIYRARFDASSCKPGLIPMSSYTSCGHVLGEAMANRLKEIHLLTPGS